METSSDKNFPISQLDRLCYKAQRENLNFDIRVESNLKSPPKSQYASFFKFWNKYYEVSDKPDGRPENNNCWTMNYGGSIKDFNNYDTFDPSPVLNCNIYKMGEYIDWYIRDYANGSKRNVTFNVRISLDNPKHTKWM